MLLTIHQILKLSVFTRSRRLAASWPLPMILLVVIFSTGAWQILSSDVVAATAGSSQLSDRVSRQLLYVQKLLDQKKIQEAQNRLTEMVGKSRLHDYEAAVIYQTLGYVYAENNDHKNTIKAFEKSLEYDVLSTIVQQSLRLNLGQLYLSLGDYEKGTSILEQWLASEKTSNKQIHELLAIGYYHQQLFKKSLLHLNKVIDSTGQPKKGLYQLAAAIHFELSLFKESVELLQKAVKLFPQEKDFWRQLAYVYRELDQAESAVATLSLAYKTGLLDADDILLLARLYLSQEIPYKAAELIQREIESGTIPVNTASISLLARSWRQARELDKAASSYATLASMEKDGEAYYQQAQVYLEMQQWKPAVIALENALDKGLEQHKGRAYLLLGVARYELNQLDSAKRALKYAAEVASIKTQAQQWLQQVKTSQEEQKELCELQQSSNCGVFVSN